MTLIKIDIGGMKNEIKFEKISQRNAWNSAYRHCFYGGSADE
jgi:hypothetical protein